MPQDPFYTILPDRGLVTLTGPERHAFLQALITQDMSALTPEQPLYSCLLTPQGKFLHDFFVSETLDGQTLLDCEGGTRAQDLAKRLNLYRLRKKLDITVQDHIPVYAVFNASNGLPDPRHADMGRRSFEKPEGITEAPFTLWDEHRIRLGIPDGSRDLVIGQSTLDEGRIAAFHGVSYTKGCYVGQELTARMHYRGLGKKHLQTVNVNALPIGAELRSSCGPVGLALVRA